MRLPQGTGVDIRRPAPSLSELSGQRHPLSLNLVDFLKALRCQICPQEGARHTVLPQSVFKSIWKALQAVSHSSTLAWKIPWVEEPGRLQSMGVARSQTRLSDFTFTFHFHALEKEMATHSSVLAWRIPGTGTLAGLPSLGSHRVRHD